MEAPIVALIALSASRPSRISTPRPLNPSSPMHSKLGRLATNDFNQSTSYETLLQRLNWKPISHIAMERRAILIFKHLKERNHMLDNAISHINPSLHRNSRTGNGLELAMPVTAFKTTLCISLNVAKSIWNNLPKDVVEL
uniref:Uncharacterized protein n=1 Tax=Acrobeloides nanus TaxID=290746 RepID=A0A914CV99_9BILA